MGGILSIAKRLCHRIPNHTRFDTSRLITSQHYHYQHKLYLTANHSLPTMPTLSAPELQILPATAGDYEGLIAISEGVHNGVDYMPIRYHAWLKDPQRKMFVAKSEGKVVAFESFLLVDGGATAVLQGLRVAHWLRGRRVAGKMDKFLFDTVRSDHPDVTRIRLTRGENPPAALLEKFRIVHSKALIGICISAEELEETLSVLKSRIPSACQNLPPPVFLDYSEVDGLFSGPLKEEDLLPGRFFIQSWLPITTCKANLDLMQRWRVQWLCTYPFSASSMTDGLNQLSDAMANNDIANDGSIRKEVNISISGNVPSSSAFKGFLSLGTPIFPVPLGNGKHRLDIDMFGTDLSCVKIHVLLQLKAAVKALPSGGSIICIIHVEESLRDELTSLLDGFTPFFRHREQLVLEKY